MVNSLKFPTLFCAITFLSACASVGEIRDYQSKLHEQTSEHPAVADEETVARAQAGNCEHVELGTPFDVTISANDPIIVQDRSLGVLSNYQVRCVESVSFSEYLVMDASGESQGGSF